MREIRNTPKPATRPRAVESPSVLVIGTALLALLVILSIGLLTR